MGIKKKREGARWPGPQKPRFSGPIPSNGPQNGRAPKSLDFQGPTLPMALGMNEWGVPAAGGWGKWYEVYLHRTAHAPPAPPPPAVQSDRVTEQFKKSTAICTAHKIRLWCVHKKYCRERNRTKKIVKKRGEETSCHGSPTLYFTIAAPCQIDKN
jgi:hypothetical protein